MTALVFAIMVIATHVAGVLLIAKRFYGRITMRSIIDARARARSVGWWFSGLRGGEIMILIARLLVVIAFVAGAIALLMGRAK